MHAHFLLFLLGEDEKPLPMCKFGENCYRKNAEHFKGNNIILLFCIFRLINFFFSLCSSLAHLIYVFYLLCCYLVYHNV